MSLTMEESIFRYFPFVYSRVYFQIPWVSVMLWTNTKHIPPWKSFRRQKEGKKRIIASNDHKT